MSSNTISLASATTPIVATAAYVFLIAALPNLLPSRKFDVKTPLIFHNALLSIGSFILFTLFLNSLMEILSVDNSGIFPGLICDEDQTSFDRMKHLVYIFLLSKYYEFFDTLFLILKNPKKPVPSLHFIHHTLTMWIIWAGHETRFTVMWIACVLNLFIHTIMYGYWAVKGVYPKYNPWWKKHLTQLQMIQFAGNMIGLQSWKIYGERNGSSCTGNIVVYYAVQGTMIIFLVLFALWYAKSYITQKNYKKA